MDKSRSSVSAFNDMFSCMIDRQYLTTARHKQSIDYSRRCAIFYQRINTQIESYYRIIFHLPEKLKEPLEANLPIPSHQFNLFRDFLKNFFQIFTLLSDFHIQQLSKVRESRSDNLDGNYENFVENIEQYRSLQDQFEQDRSSYKSLCVRIDNKFREVTAIFKKEEQNFNPKLIRAQHDTLLSDLLEKEKLEHSINQKVDSMASNSRKFSKELVFYRQKLVGFKYQYIDRICRLCNNAKQSLMEIVTYMTDTIAQFKEAFQPSKKQEDSVLHPITDKKDIGEYITLCTNDYDIKINRYLAIFRALITIFNDISIDIREEKARQKEIAEQLRKYFEYGQCNVTEVMNTMQLYSEFLMKLGQMGDKLAYSENNMMLLQKKVNKEKQITLTILKCSTPDRKPPHMHKSATAEKIKDNQHTYLQNLFQQMGQIYIQGILNNVFRDFEDTVGRIKEKLLVGQRSKKHINHSMSISYIEQSQKEPQRRPFKADFWLWCDWRIDIPKEIVELPEVKGLVGELGKLLEKEIEEKELEKLSCTFLNRRVRGILKLRPQSIVFQSIDSTQQYLIPFFKVESIDMQLNIMSKTVIIETVHGNLTFSDESVKDIKRFYVSAQKALDFFNENNNADNAVQQTLKLTQAEIEFVKKRRIDIDGQLEKECDFEHFNTIIVDNVSISDLYRVIYSDNKIVIKGKEYACFADSLMKKYNNLNQTFKQFEPPGPQFYTGIKGVDFNNCPLYSQRIIEYDHTLPRIPFMPQSCHNKQIVRLYWVSHEEFHVKETNHTSGAPYTQNFMITMLTKVTAIDQDVQIRYFIRIDVITDFSLRKVVIGTSTDEAKWGTGILIEETKKCMMGYKRRQGNQPAQQQPLDDSNLSDRTRVKEYKQQIRSLQDKNKQLLYVLIAVFALNIILKLFF